MLSFKMFPLLTILLLLSSCSSINRRVQNSLADALTKGESSVFTTDDDPEFIASALPFGLKVYESLLQNNPTHKGLYLALASGYSSYSYIAFDFPSDTLTQADPDHINAMKARSKKFYLRGRSFAVAGLELNHPNFIRSLTRSGDSLLSEVGKEDIDLLYWAGLSWFGAFNADKFDMRLALSIPHAKRIFYRIKELDPDYRDGELDNFFITLYGAFPESMGGSLEKAKEHYERALKLAPHPTADPHISYARTVLVQNRDRDEFLRVLRIAAAIRPDSHPENLLQRTIKQAEARWLIQNVDNFFL